MRFMPCHPRTRKPGGKPSSCQVDVDQGLSHDDRNCLASF